MMYTNINKFMNNYSSLINDISHSLHEAYIEQCGSIAWLFDPPRKYKFLNTQEEKLNKNINLILVVDLLHLCYLSSTKSIYFHNGTIIEDNNMIIENNNSIIEDNNTIIENNNSIIEDNNMIIEDNNIKRDNKSHVTWRKIIHELLLRNEIDLAIYTLAVRKFLRHKNIILAYYTTMISDCKIVDFDQQVLLIDIECIKRRMEETGKSLWRIIKDNDVLISKYENNNMEKLNFWRSIYSKSENINKYETKLSVVNNDEYPQVYYKFIDIDKYTKNNIINQNLFIRL